jgi:hypothetical protein
MWSSLYSPDLRIPGMGLGFLLDRLGDHRVVGHDGNLPGFAAGLLLASDEGLGVVVLTDTATLFGMHLLARSVLQSVLGVALIGLNLAAFSKNPGRAGLVDVGTLVGGWYLWVTLRMANSLRWAPGASPDIRKALSTLLRPRRPGVGAGPGSGRCRSGAIMGW